MTEQHVGERRRHQRARLGVTLTVGDNVSPTTYVLRDISIVGASLQVPEPIPEMTLVGIGGTFGGDPLPLVRFDAEAAVVRCDPLDDGTYEVGLYFTRIDEDCRRQIDAFVTAANRI